MNVTVNPTEPGLLAPASFTINGTPYAAAFFSDGTSVLPTGAIVGVSSRPAKPGDTIILYGVGFGPVSPSIPAGQLVQQSNMLASSFQMLIGGMPATVAMQDWPRGSRAFTSSTSLYPALQQELSL